MNNDNNIRKGKPTIEPIVIPEDKKQKLDKVLNYKHTSHSQKERAIKQIVGGFCCLCENPPTQILKYKLEDATLIERYCDKCIEKVK